MMILLASCSHTNEKNNVLTVRAAASMKDVLEAIGKQYEKEHYNVTLRFIFASTGTLQKQIEQGVTVQSKQQKAAKQWVVYLYSDKAAAFFQKYGFIVPGK
jgi:ABC-type molybdate transport system substrate-binding protein